MAIAVQSTTLDGAFSATSVAPTKPTGLAVGDLLICQFMSGATGRTFTLPSGFTQIQLITDANQGDMQISQKVADSSDVAASDFTFSVSGAATPLTARLTRITGARGVTPVNNSSSNDHNASDTTSMTAPTITPSYANSMIVFYVMKEATGNGTSGYVLATDNISWTEQYDATNNSAFRYAMAYGNRVQITATGTATATSDGGVNTRYTTVLLSIDPILSFTNTILETSTMTDIKIFNIGLIFTEIVSITEQLVSPIREMWAYVTKQITTWIFQDRS